MTRVWTVWAEENRLIDGDTIVFDLDLGWGIWRRAVHVRVLGINCPELPTPEGEKAKAATERWLESNTLGAPYRIESHSVDHFGRVLGTVGFQNPVGEWQDLAAYLLSTGDAVPDPGPK